MPYLAGKAADVRRRVELYEAVHLYDFQKGLSGNDVRWAYLLSVSLDRHSCRARAGRRVREAADAAEMDGE